MPGVIVPRKAVTEIRKLIDGADGAVQVAVSESVIRFTLDGATLTSKLIDGTFPDYERVIPTTNRAALVADVSSYKDAIRRVAVVSSGDDARPVKLNLESGRLMVSASNANADSASETLDVSYDGPVLEIGFNSRYLLDVLACITGDRVTMTFLDSASPTLVRDAGDPGALYVLMPMRVK